MTQLTPAGPVSSRLASGRLPRCKPSRPSRTAPTAASTAACWPASRCRRRPSSPARDCQSDWERCSAGMPLASATTAKTSGESTRRGLLLLPRLWAKRGVKAAGAGAAAALLGCGLAPRALLCCCCCCCRCCCCCCCCAAWRRRCCSSFSPCMNSEAPSINFS